MTCQIYTMPARRLAAIPKGAEHPHQRAPEQGATPFGGIDCIHQTWGLF